MELEKLTYTLLKAPNNDVRQLLAETVYGTKGGLRLHHFDTAWKLDELIAPDYHVLYNGETLVGVVVYTNRRARFGDSEMNSLYIRYFSISPAYQNLGVAQYLTKVAVSHYKNTLREPTVVYAYIEAKNFRSQAVSDHFEPLSLGHFSPIYFSRFFPKKQTGVSSDRKDFDRLYPSTVPVNFSYQGRSDKNANYFTKTVKDRFATVRCYPVKWEVLQYPNKDGLMKKVLPKIPIIKKLVEGKELNFVAVDAVSWNDNEMLLSLLEHVLADYGLSKLMLFADLSDARFKELRNHSKLGTMSKLQKPPKVGIQLFFHECSAAFKQEIQNYPVEIRGFDVT